jgi:hypothetical protein
MNTRLAAALSALAAGAVLGANGCAEAHPSVQIQQICAPTANCTFAATCDAQYIGWVTLDTTTSAKDNLWLVLQVANLTQNNAQSDAGRVNTHDAHVDEIAMEYVGVALPPTTIGANFDAPASGTAVVSAEVIPDALQAGPALAALAPSAEPREIVVKTRFRGFFDDGTRFETNVFPITVRVCAGCVGTVCGGGPTCPPRSEGQLPLSCVQ